VLLLVDCSVGIKQSLGSSWKQDGKDMSQWNVQLTAGSETVKSLELSITGATLTQVWELTRQSNGLFALPDYRLQSGGIVAGQVHQFGYIWESAAQATITVASINCGTTAPSASPSTAPASPSVSPAAPSASPSAVPSIVASPQPSPSSGCSVSVTQTARSANAGGSWTDGAYIFQLYDLAIVNNGNSPVTAAQLTISLAAGQSITQSWNIELKSGTASTYIVPNTYGPLQIGATLGAGYVLRSPLATGQPAAPAIAIDSVTCSGSPTANPSAAPASPSPSASPVAPSASPSAAPTIVATPQPSPSNGCGAVVTVTARSAAAGGVWTENGNTFQIFDINLANSGQRPVNGGVLTFAFAEASATITQFWELNRQGATNAFNVPFNYGPLQVGAIQGSGIIVRVSGSSPAAKPSTTLNSLSCQ
jgi:hypothetical protein